MVDVCGCGSCKEKPWSAMLAGSIYKCGRTVMLSKPSIATCTSSCDTMDCHADSKRIPVDWKIVRKFEG